MKVVADTGPINYLILIGQSSTLHALFETVWIAEAVRSELEHPGAPSDVRKWIGSPPKWLVVRPVERSWEHGLELLGNGERGSIGLAQSLGADLIVMDDRLGVSRAQSRGFTVTGTLGVLQRGAERGIVDLADAFEQLRKTSFRVRAELLEDILAHHRRGRSDE